MLQTEAAIMPVVATVAEVTLRVRASSATTRAWASLWAG
jgi:hypothetical protein